MATQTISLATPNPNVEVKRVGGNLQIEGWGKQELEATGEALDVNRENESMTVSAGGETRIQMPRGATVRIGFVGGRLEIRGMQGPIEIAFVGSDLELRDLSGQVTLHGLVGGTTRLENVSHFDGATSGPGGPGWGEAGRWGNAEKILGKAEEKRRQVEKKIRQAERKLGRMRVGIGKEGARWKWGAPVRTGQKLEGTATASDEERMTILRMLQEKKITAEEAERLLSALEGQA